MKNYILSLSVLIVFVLQMLSCNTEHKKNCQPIKKLFEIKLNDTTGQSMYFSPIDEGKIWLNTNGKDNEILEVDVSNSSLIRVDKQFSKYVNFPYKYHQKDNYDSLVWFGTPNVGSNVCFYNLRIKKISELPISCVSRIISRPEAVYFVSLQGLCYWDRKSESVLPVKDIPQKYIRNSEMFNDSTIILDCKYTYNFNSRKFKEGIYFHDYEHKGGWATFKVQDNCGIFYNNESLFYTHNGVVDKLPPPFEDLSKIKIIDRIFWQNDDKYFYSFDPKLKAIKKYSYRLPDLNNYSFDFEVDSKYIWIMCHEQLILIRLSDNKEFEYPFSPQDKYINTLFDKCNVYTNFNRKIRLSSKEDFIKTCQVFDIEQFDNEIRLFDSIVDSLNFFVDTIPKSSLAKLNFLKAKFSNSKNVSVKKKLEKMNERAFQSNLYKLPNGYIDCYTDSTMPIVQRKKCIQELLNSYGRQSNFDKALHLKKEFLKYFGKPDDEEKYYFFSALDSVEVYLSKIKKIKFSNISEDSIYYYQSIALETICMTPWHCSQGCAGCDFTLVSNKLKRFLKKYPNSNLYDNAVLYLIHLQNMYEDEDQMSLKNIRHYEDFLSKYPNSDVKADAIYYIFKTWLGMNELDKKKVKAAAKRFINEFPTDYRVPEVKNYIILI